MNTNPQIIISGSHMELTEILKQTVNSKLKRLLTPNNQIVKIRVDLAYNHRKDSKEDFAAKGHVEIHGTNFNISKDDDNLEATVDKMIDKHHKKVLKSQYTAKGHIELRGKDIHASEDSEDLYKSIDKMIDKLERLLHERADINKTKRNHPHEIDLPADIPKTQT